MWSGRGGIVQRPWPAAFAQSYVGPLLVAVIEADEAARLKRLDIRQACLDGSAHHRRRHGRTTRIQQGRIA